MPFKRGFEYFEKAANEYAQIVEELGDERAFAEILEAYETEPGDAHWLRQAINQLPEEEDPQV